MTMRVAFDGKFLRMPPCGIGEYVASLVPAMRAADSSLDLHVIEPAWDHGEGSARGSRHRVGRIQRVPWELVGVHRAARAFKPDLLHIPAFSAPIRSAIPLVVTIHDVIPLVLPAYRESWVMQMYLAVMRRTVKRAKLVIAPSCAAADDISAHLAIPRELIRVTLEAADPTYRPCDDPQTCHDAMARFGIRGRYIFNVGGLDVRKNVPLLIEAFARLRARVREPLQLVIAGAPHSDNPAVFPPLGPTIRRLGLESDVLLTGRVSEADKITLYQCAALYVTPSSYEGFGLTPLEAMACGTPTIAANRTSFPEVIGDGGLLVEIDADAIAATMELVLTNDAVARDLRARGIARATTFSWERAARETLAVYREAIGAETRHPKRAPNFANTAPSGDAQCRS
ncbi:MAG TPA: glycosyltransferase family 1 protein [Ramlibacter sp.]|nr:glycosyltransferase family 1 protein [Ramlibacter sp.]